jgi:hypothetical protein
MQEQAPRLRAALVAAANTRLHAAGVVGHRWGTAKAPALADLSPLRCHLILAEHLWEPLLTDTSDPTILESADGVWGQAVAAVGHVTLLPSAALAAAFRQHVEPSELAVSTRSKNWRNWRAVVSWGIAHNDLASLLPMNLTTLQAISWEFLNLDCKANHIKDVWSAIAQRHRQYRAASPFGRGQFTRMLRSLQAVQGAPSSLKFPIRAHHVRLLLSNHGTDIVALRNRLITTIGTIGCLRVSEIANLQACDALFNFDMQSGSEYDGTLALRVRKRKNDQVRKGHHPRFGRSVNPDLDIVFQLGEYMRLGGLRVSAGCRKAQAPAALCPACPPLFPKSRQHGGKTILSSSPCYPQLVGDAIKSALRLAGVDTSHFSGISARKGGLSTAIEAGVPATVLYMQSGHGQDEAAKKYVALGSPTLLFDTWRAFQL